MAHDFVIADVFTAVPFGGNQLAVFPDAAGLSDRAMQAIAREFNFAETTFVLPPRDPSHSRRVRIFTPKAEVPFAGHPTVGTAVVLARQGAVPTGSGRALVLEEGIGPVRVEIAAGHEPFSAQLVLETTVESPLLLPDRRAVTAALSLAPDALRGAWFASVGLPFCFAHLADAETVDRATLDLAAWRAGLAGAWSSNVFLFAGDPAPDGRLYARMFAPALGVTEDPATGSACAALVGTLALRRAADSGTFACEIAQGVALGRPSRIQASATRGNGEQLTIRVGGAAVITATGSMTVPEGL